MSSTLSPRQYEVLAALTDGTLLRMSSGMPAHVYLMRKQQNVGRVHFGTYWSLRGSGCLQDVSPEEEWRFREYTISELGRARFAAAQAKGK